MAKTPKTPPVLAAFGRRARALREAAGYTQEEFAHRVGMDPSFYGKVERGEVNVSLLRAAEVARGLGAELWELLRPEGA